MKENLQRLCGGGGLRTAEESEEAAFQAPAACQISEAALESRVRLDEPK